MVLDFLLEPMDFPSPFEGFGVPGSLNFRFRQPSTMIEDGGILAVRPIMNLTMLSFIHT